MAIRPEVREEILTLSREDRHELADEIYESLVDEPLDPEWERAWSREIVQRVPGHRRWSRRPGRRRRGPRRATRRATRLEPVKPTRYHPVARDELRAAIRYSEADRGWSRRSTRGRGSPCTRPAQAAPTICAALAAPPESFRDSSCARETLPVSRGLRPPTRPARHHRARAYQRATRLLVSTGRRSRAIAVASRSWSKAPPRPVVLDTDVSGTIAIGHAALR